MNWIEFKNTSIDLCFCYPKSILFPNDLLGNTPELIVPYKKRFVPNAEDSSVLCELGPRTRVLRTP